MSLDHPKYAMNPTHAGPIITVAMLMSEWQHILKYEPLDKETYTPEGEAILAAWQTIHRAIDAA